ncbi:MAG: hypothetical protein ISS52_03090 [Dehalococcoidia bacterium]|nr:hypothetical protein [Dehalococcoidia bacterium]
MKEKLPQLGQEVSTALGKAKVVGSNVLRETVSAQLETGVTVEFPVAEITWLSRPPPESQRRNR